MTGFMNMKKLTLFSAMLGVLFVMAAATDLEAARKQQPLEISSDRLEMDDKHRVAVFIGR